MVGGRSKVWATSIVIAALLTLILFVWPILDSVANRYNVGMPENSKFAAAAPARDGNIAILEEYEMARSQNTLAAYQLFIARHPGHPLAKDAHREIDGLSKRNKNN